MVRTAYSIVLAKQIYACDTVSHTEASGQAAPRPLG